MYTTLAVAIGGALGAVSRYYLSMIADRWNAGAFPLGTFTVNILGSLLIGVCFVIFMEKAHLAAAWRPLLVVGFLGALTTFSTYSLDALLLIQQGHYNTAFFYIVSSVLLCLLAAWAGMQMARIII